MTPGELSSPPQPRRSVNAGIPGMMPLLPGGNFLSGQITQVMGSFDLLRWFREMVWRHHAEQEGSPVVHVTSRGSLVSTRVAGSEDWVKGARVDVVENFWRATDLAVAAGSPLVLADVEFLPKITHPAAPGPVYRAKMTSVFVQNIGPRLESTGAALLVLTEAKDHRNVAGSRVWGFASSERFFLSREDGGIKIECLKPRSGLSFGASVVVCPETGLLRSSSLPEAGA